MSPQEAHDIAAEAYIYFYPLITMDVTRRDATNTPAGKRLGFGPENEFSQIRIFPPADFKAVVRPNFDTLCSSAWLDLSKGPVLLSVPDTEGRYYLLPMLDMWTDVFAMPGKRTSGAKAGLFAITPQGWKGELPEGAQRIDAPTAHVWIIDRTQYPVANAIDRFAIGDRDKCRFAGRKNRSQLVSDRSSDCARMETCLKQAGKRRG